MRLRRHPPSSPAPHHGIYYGICDGASDHHRHGCSIGFSKEFITNLTVYVPKDLEAELHRRAEQAGMTPSLFVQSVLRAAMAAQPAAFSPAFSALAGSWEDARSADEILADIREHRTKKRRPVLK